MEQNILNSEIIMQTELFQTLDKFHQEIILRRANRKTLHHALEVWKNTGYIQLGLGVKNFALINELIGYYKSNGTWQK